MRAIFVSFVSFVDQEGRAMIHRDNWPPRLGALVRLLPRVHRALRAFGAPPSTRMQEPVMKAAAGESND